MSLQMCFDSQSLSLSKSGVIWGGVWLECKGIPFPETKWNDMVVAFGCEVLGAVRLFRGGSSARNLIRFFDGPYWVELDPASHGQLSVETRARHPGVGWTCVTALDEFVNALEAVCSEIVDRCDERGWGEQADVRRLAAMLQSSGCNGQSQAD